MNPASTFQTLAWGIFCACSWTWCIGMYLPAFMLNRFGWPGFFAFAIPNVIGCGAFGYVLKNRQRSLELVAKHSVAMRCFSLITIAFHVFFLGFACLYLLPESLQSVWLPLLVVPLVIAISWLASAMPIQLWPLLALPVYGFSLFAFSQVGLEPLQDIPGAGQWPAGELFWITLTLIFGFLLCPYLDPTFHRALQESNRPHAFGVFGITFAVMIVFTCAYWTIAESKLTNIIIAHLLVQSIFTIAAHMREIRALSKTNCRWRMSLSMLGPLVVLPFVYVGVFFDDPFRAVEDTYIRFLVFYGLVFPAYVLLFMGPLKTMTLTKKNLMAVGIVVIASTPFYEAGYLHQLAWVMVVPLVVLLGMALRPRRG